MHKVPPRVKVVKAEQKGWKRELQSHLEPEHPNLAAQSVCPDQGNHSWDPSSVPADLPRELNPTRSEKHPALGQEGDERH